MVRSTILVAAAAALAQLANAHYAVDTVYDSTNFFQEFNHFTDPDPTHGFVEYVDQNTAQAAGLSGIQKGAIYMGVDSVTKYPANGRRSVRLESQKTFTRGLFVADIAHMPTNACGVWPAFWTFGPNWPVAGEIDIIEGVNTQTKTSVTLHTGPSCEMNPFGVAIDTKVVSNNCSSINGCGQNTADNQNYGDGFNAIGGGVYAMEWNDYHIAIWFFPRSKIPQDITTDHPEPLLWGRPMASFSAGATCNSETFKDHKIVFDTTFCGDWAGSAWAADAECSAHAPTCNDYVSANPEAFGEAYWQVNSLKVFKASADFL